MKACQCVVKDCRTKAHANCVKLSAPGPSDVNVLSRTAAPRRTPIVSNFPRRVHLFPIHDESVQRPSRRPPPRYVVEGGVYQRPAGGNGLRQTFRAGSICFSSMTSPCSARVADRRQGTWWRVVSTSDPLEATAVSYQTFKDHQDQCGHTLVLHSGTLVGAACPICDTPVVYIADGVVANKDVTSTPSVYFKYGKMVYRLSVPVGTQPGNQQQ
jgi:hypothetical protein